MRGAAALYEKLQENVNQDPRRRAALVKWLQAARRQRQVPWRERKQRQHRKSGGQICGWSAEDGYTTMAAETHGADQTSETKLEAAARAWGAMPRR